MLYIHIYNYPHIVSKKHILSDILFLCMCCFGSSVGLQKTGLTPLLFLDEQDGMCPYVCGGSCCNPKFRSFLLGMPGESSWKLSFIMGPRTAFGSRGTLNPQGPRPFAKRKGPGGGFYSCQII